MDCNLGPSKSCRVGEQELQGRGVKTVDEAIAVAESLTDFRTSGPSESSKKKEQGMAKGGGARRDTARPSNSRSFEKARSNDKPTRVMVDTGATHNFMTLDEAVRLGVKWSKKDGWMKTVNARAQPVNGIARGVGMKLGSWSGPVNFSVIPMDDFKVVLGMDFMRQVSAIHMPALGSVCILEKGSPCMIPALEENIDGMRQLSAMQLTKGVKRGEPTFLAMMKVEDVPNNVEYIPQIIETILEENKDVMPAKLPEKLPPRRICK
uniref:Aspartic peptidase DDI1-type domain-containing protein n=1 Tax=Brassica oleracea var. oleracea TaxID=109376 RepID=A0A0D2ZSS8_BRAOL